MIDRLFLKSNKARPEEFVSVISQNYDSARRQQAKVDDDERANVCDLLQEQRVIAAPQECQGSPEKKVKKARRYVFQRLHLCFSERRHR